MKLETYLTNKKLLLSLCVVAGAVFLLSIGVLFHNRIINKAEEKARLYRYALQVENDTELNYSIDTKQNNIFAEVTLNQVDSVRFDEMNKDFVKIVKTKERYTRHERTVCETKYRTQTVYDATTGTSSTEQVAYEECHQETYYTWDEVDRWEKSAQEVEMAGRKYPTSIFALQPTSIDAKDVIDGQSGKYMREEVDTWFDIGWGDNEGDVRYGYEVLSLPKSGTVFLNVTDHVRPVFGTLIELQSKSPEELVTEAQNAVETQSAVFTWFWVIFMISCVGSSLYFVWTYNDY